MTKSDRDPFIEEVQRLKREAAARTPTLDELARRLREIDRKHKGRVVQPPPKPRTDAA
ncbi:MAG: hypothetical protein KIS87_01880 [Phycisphaeraceae bacterium]|nr:hypothetical protein [Phycisphaeraceae bacterium]